MKKQIEAVQAFADRHSLLLGAVLAALLAGTLALYNVFSGPLSNLNDIGGWSNRALFIVMTAAAHAAVLLDADRALQKELYPAGDSADSADRRIGHSAAGNQSENVPVRRAGASRSCVRMDEVALAAESPLNLSAPGLTVLYAVTRGPIYDLYMLKLLCIVCFLALAVLAAYAADRHELGWRAEILRRCRDSWGFLAAGCAAQIEVLSALLLGISLTLQDEKRSIRLPRCCFTARRLRSAARHYTRFRWYAGWAERTA